MSAGPFHHPRPLPRFCLDWAEALMSVGQLIVGNLDVMLDGTETRYWVILDDSQCQRCP